MIIQPQCFTYPCDPIGYQPQPADLPNVRYDRVYTAGQYPSTPNYSTAYPTTGYPTPSWIGSRGQEGKPPGGAYPSTANGGIVPDFRTSTDTLDKYRVLLLIVGIAIGVWVFSK